METEIITGGVTKIWESNVNLHIGSRTDGANIAPNGTRISHVIVVAGTLTDAEAQDLLDYL